MVTIYIYIQGYLIQISARLLIILTEIPVFLSPTRQILGYYYYCCYYYYYHIHYDCYLTIYHLLSLHCLQFN